MPSLNAQPPRHGWLIANLLAQLAFGLLAMTIGLPSMQDWPATFNASQAAVQLTFSGYVLSYGLLQLVYGCVFRTNVTGDFGIVTEDSGPS